MTLVLVSHIGGLSDWFRVVLGFSSAACVIMLGVRIIFVWKRYHWTQQMVFVILMCYNIEAAGRSYEIVMSDQENFSIWLFFGFVANTLLIIYLWEPRRRYETRIGQDLRNPPESDGRSSRT